MAKQVKSSDSFAIQRQPMRKPVATPRAGAYRDGPVAGLLRLSFRFRYGSVVRRSLRLHRPMTRALGLAILSKQPAAAASTLPLPLANPNPPITARTEQHYPTPAHRRLWLHF